MPLSDYAGYFQSAGKQYGIDPDLLQAVASVESGGNPNAVSPQGATGPMQFMPQTAKSMGISDPTDPSQAIPAAAKLLAQNAAQFGSPESAILAYHGGTDQKNWGPKTQAYLAKVAQTYQQLKSSPQVAAQTNTSDPQDAFSAAFSGAPVSAQAAPSKVPSSPQAQTSTKATAPDAFSVAFSGTPAATKLAQSSNTFQQAGAGIVQGLRDVGSSFDPAWQFLHNNVPPELTAAVPLVGPALASLSQNAPQIAASNLAARHDYEKQYADSSVAPGGRVIGNIAGSVPLMAGGDAIAGAAKGLPIVSDAANALAQAANKSKLVSYGLNAARGAAQGAEAGALTSGGSDTPFMQQVKQGAEVGGVLGVGAPALSDLGTGTYNILTGGGIAPARSALANTAITKFGIPLRGSQISNSPFMNFLDSNLGKLPGTGLEAQNEAQRSAFSRAVAGTFGESADNLTPQVMASARSRIGNVFNTVANNTVIGKPATDIMLNDFSQIENDAKQVMGPNEYSPIKNQMDTILSKVSPNGEIDGTTYQAITRKGAPLDSALNSKDPNIRQYAGQIRSSLDDALQASAAPEDVQALQTARLQWKNMRTVQDLASKAGIEGEISPPLLLNAVKKSYKDMPYSGAGDIGDLAHIGQDFLRPPPSSGTAERIALWDMLKGAGGLGAGDAIFLHDPNALMHTAATGAGLLGAGHVISNGVPGLNALGEKLGIPFSGGLKSQAYRDILLNSASRNQGAFNNLFGGSGVNRAAFPALSRYAKPAAMVGGNQLFMNPAPVASPQLTNTNPP